MSGTTDVAVIGAGPAGLSAAATAADAGLTVVILDNQPDVGGQIYRGIRAADDHAASHSRSRLHRWSGSSRHARTKARQPHRGRVRLGGDAGPADILFATWQGGRAAGSACRALHGCDREADAVPRLDDAGCDDGRRRADIAEGLGSHASQPDRACRKRTAALPRRGAIPAGGASSGRDCRDHTPGQPEARASLPAWRRERELLPPQGTRACSPRSSAGAFGTIGEHMGSAPSVTHALLPSDSVLAAWNTRSPAPRC